MKALAEQSAKHSIESGIAQVFVVLGLVTPSLFAFLASLTFHSPWATAAGLVVLLSSISEHRLWCDTGSGGFDGAGDLRP